MIVPNGQNLEAVSTRRALRLAGHAVFVLLGALPADQARAQYRPIVVGERSDAVDRRLTVFRGRAEVLRYRREPGTVIVGNEALVAVSFAAADILVLTGLQPGETNVIILDDDGREIDRISVSIVERGRDVVVSRGQERQYLRCAPACGPADGESASPSATAIPPRGGLIDTLSDEEFLSED